MNYQHAYHAGNSADVFKHIVLMALLNYLKQKEKPFCYIDTHAGEGEYDLTQTQSQEWQDGAGKLQHYSSPNTLLDNYLKYTQDLSHFPGSPKIAKYLLRPQDEIILIEKSAAAYTRLKSLFLYDKQVHIHHADAYQILNGLLPPVIKRGLILIDPPYEDKNEFDQIIIFLKETLKKFATGIYTLWYPIKSRAYITQFYQSLKKQILSEILMIEFCAFPDDVAIRLNGSGMMIIHPPWQFEKILTPVLEILISKLKKHPKGFYKFIQV